MCVCVVFFFSDKIELIKQQKKTRTDIYQLYKSEIQTLIDNNSNNNNNEGGIHPGYCQEKTSKPGGDRSPLHTRHYYNTILQ